ncbi:MAG: acetylxylan esterase [Saprospiraceae bacterium]
MLENNKSPMRTNSNLYQILKAQCLVVVFSLSALALSAQVQLSVARTNAQYEVGEWINFSVSAATTGSLNYRISNGHHQAKLYEGTLEVVAGESYDIPFQTTEPGFLQCIISQNNQETMATVAVSPFEIQPYETEPNDFDAFWQSVKTELAQVPMNAQLNEMSNTTYASTYRVKLANLGNRSVYGYLSVPTGDGPFPAILSLPDFGDAAGQVQPATKIAEEGNALSFTISIHNTKPTATDAQAYLPNVLSNRDSIYYKFAIAAAMRSIDYIFSRSDFDGENVGVIGVGQGAGLATCVAGIDQRVKLLVSNVASMGQHNGYQYNRTSAQPNYLAETRQASNYTPAKELAVQQAIQYYDVLHFAKRFEGASLSYLGYLDQNNPPATTFAIFNQLGGNKLLGHSLELSGPHPNYEEEQFKFFRQNFPAMMNPPNPSSSSTTTTYEVNAGEDQLVFLPSSAEVTGFTSIDGEDTSSNTKVSWNLHEGPAAVLFVTPKQQTSAVIFNQYGIYEVEFKTNTYDFSGAEPTFYDGVDYLYIGVSIF